MTLFIKTRRNAELGSSRNEILISQTVAQWERVGNKQGGVPDGELGN
jgi:hypothetical protein